MSNQQFEGADRFDTLKRKGWNNLDKPEREEYVRLNALAKAVKSTKPSVAFEKKDQVAIGMDDGKLEELNKKMSILMKAVDPDKLNASDKQEFEKFFPKKKTMPLVKVSFWDGKIIMSWKTTVNTVRTTMAGAGTGKIEEIHKMELTLEDESKIEVDANEFEFRTQVVVELEEMPSKNKEGLFVYRFKYNGKDYSLLDLFIN